MCYDRKNTHVTQNTGMLSLTVPRWLSYKWLRICSARLSPEHALFPDGVDKDSEKGRT